MFVGSHVGLVCTSAVQLRTASLHGELDIDPRMRLSTALSIGLLWKPLRRPEGLPLLCTASFWFGGLFAVG